MAEKVLSTKPYLLRAFYEWIVDSEMTPHIVVNALFPEIKVPEQYVEDGRIVLNISPEATQGFVVGSEWLEFSASFSQVVEHIALPISAVLAIYAEENGKGMVFNEEDDDGGDGGDDKNEPPSAPTGSTSKVGKSKRPNLRIVK